MYICKLPEVMHASDLDSHGQPAEGVLRTQQDGEVDGVEVGDDAPKAAWQDPRDSAIKT